jgi:hypothetical protein
MHKKLGSATSSKQQPPIASLFTTAVLQCHPFGPADPHFKCRLHATLGLTTTV